MGRTRIWRDRPLSDFVLFLSLYQGLRHSPEAFFILERVDMKPKRNAAIESGSVAGVTATALMRRIARQVVLQILRAETNVATDPASPSCQQQPGKTEMHDIKDNIATPNPPGASNSIVGAMVRGDRRRR